MGMFEAPHIGFLLLTRSVPAILEVGSLQSVSHGSSSVGVTGVAIVRLAWGRGSRPPECVFVSTLGSDDSAIHAREQLRPRTWQDEGATLARPSRAPRLRAVGCRAPGPRSPTAAQATAATARQRLGGDAARPCVCLLIGSGLSSQAAAQDDLEDVLSALAERLSHAVPPPAAFVASGPPAVTSHFARAFLSPRRLWHAVARGRSGAVGVVEDLVCGDDEAERRAVLGELGDIYIIVGSGALPAPPPVSWALACPGSAPGTPRMCVSRLRARIAWWVPSAFPGCIPQVSAPSAAGSCRVPTFSAPRAYTNHQPNGSKIRRMDFPGRFGCACV